MKKLEIIPLIKSLYDKDFNLCFKIFNTDFKIECNNIIVTDGELEFVSNKTGSSFIHNNSDILAIEKSEKMIKIIFKKSTIILKEKQKTLKENEKVFFSNKNGKILEK